MVNRQQQRRGTGAAWSIANPVLAPGELGLETDTGKMKAGDGITAWGSLAYFAGGAGGSGSSFATTVAVVSDLKFPPDVTSTAGSAIVRSASNAFASAVVGQKFWLNGAGAAGAVLDTTIASVQNAGQVTLAVTAGTTVSARLGGFGTDNHVAIEAALGRGVHLLIPSNTLWVPTASTTPPNCTIEGQDWEKVVVKSQNVNTDLLALGASTEWINVSFWDSFSQVLPLATLDTLPVPRAARHLINNDTSSTYAPQTYPWQGFTLTTGLQANQGIDRPGITVTNWGIGGSYFAEVKSDQAPGFHADMNANDQTKGGHGVLIYNHGTGHGIEIQGYAGSTGDLLVVYPSANLRSLVIAPTVNTTVDIQYTTATKTGGQIVLMTQSTTTFNGQVLMLNMGTAGGTFYGQFLYCQVNGTLVFMVDYGGQIKAMPYSNARLPTVGDLTAGQWTVWKDTAGGGLYLCANDGGAIKKVALL